MPNNDNLRLQSEEAQEILGTPPSWMIRWGTMIIFLALLLLALAAWIVPVPEVVKADVTITRTGEPISFSLDAGTRQFVVLVKDSTSVDLNKSLIYRDIDGDWKDFFNLELEIKKLKDTSDLDLAAYVPVKNPNLGSIQQAFDQFQQRLENYKFGQDTEFDKKSISELLKEKASIEESIDIAREVAAVSQKKINSEGQIVEILQEKYGNYEISHEEYNSRLSEFRELEGDVKRILLEITNKEQQINRLDKQILDIRQGSVEGDQERLQELKRSLDVLWQQFRVWRQERMVLATVPGIIRLSEGITFKESQINSGQEILSLQPFMKKKKEFVVFAELKKLDKSGKIEIGQRAIIRLPGYPPQEFGILEARVKEKPYYEGNDEKLNFELELLNGLTTTKNESIPYQFAVKGEAEIIIEEKRFLMTLFERLI